MYAYVRIVCAHCGGGCERWRMDGALMKGSVNIRRRNTHWVLSSHYTPEQTHLLTFLEPLSPSLSLCFLPTIFFLDSSGAEWQLLTSHTPSRHLSVTQDLFKSQNTTHTHTHCNYRPIFVNSIIKVLYCIFKLFVIMTATFTKKAIAVLDEERSVVLFIFFTYLSLSPRSQRTSELVSIYLGKHVVTVKDLQSRDTKGVEMPS